MDSVQGVVPGSASDSPKPDVHERLGRMTDRSRAARERAAVATRDVARLAGIERLHDLPTLETLADRFAQAAAIADRHQGRLALLLVDFDTAPATGDGVGREADARCVVDIVRRLSGSVRTGDIVCRLAGDRFVVVLTDVAHDSDATSASRNLLLGLEDSAATADCDIGISFYPDHGRDVETLIGAADAAMNRAKASGPGRCRSASGAAVVDCSAPLPVVLPVERRNARRAPPIAVEAEPNDELREIRKELLRISIEARDAPDRAHRPLRIAFAAADVGHWSLDLKSGETVRSVRHDELFGYPTPLQHWDLGTTLERFVSEDRAEVTIALHEARTIGFVDFEYRIRRADDLSVRWLHVSGETVYRAGVALRIVGIVADVTERRAVEDRSRQSRQSRQSRKREAVGRPTDSVAHDVDDALIETRGCVDLLAQRLSSEQRTDRPIGTIHRAVADGSRLDRQRLGSTRRKDALR